MLLAVLGMIVCNVRQRDMLFRRLLRTVAQPSEFTGSSKAFSQAILHNVILLQLQLLSFIAEAPRQIYDLALGVMSVSWRLTLLTKHQIQSSSLVKQL